MSDRKPTQRKRPPRRNRKPRSVNVRRAERDDDQVNRNGGHVVTINGRGDLSLLTSLLGGVAKTLIGPLLDTFMGNGDYKLRRNSLVINGSPPKLTADGKFQDVRIQHREFVSYIVSNASSGAQFNLVSYPLQPGLSGTFPWLSQIAAAYQEYEILGMVAYYKPTSGNATGSNTSLGEVILSTNYNSAAPNFLNAQQMLNAEFATTVLPSTEGIHMIECDPHQSVVSELYVRTDAVPTGQDQRLYDFANLQVATQGNQTAGQQLGELWIAYDISFKKPILGGVVSGLDIPTDHFQLTTVTGSTPLGTSQKTTVVGGIGGTINGATGTIYTFPSTISSGTWLVIFQCQGTAASTTAPIIATNLSWSQIQMWSNNSAPDGKTSVVSTNSINNATFVQAFVISVSPTPTLPLTITWGTGGTLPTAPCFGDLLVTQVNTNLIGFLRSSEDYMRDLVRATLQDFMDESDYMVRSKVRHSVCPRCHGSPCHC